MTWVDQHNEVGAALAAFESALPGINSNFAAKATPTN
jgi:hypothetical protein